MSQAIIAAPPSDATNALLLDSYRIVNPRTAVKQTSRRERRNYVSLAYIYAQRHYRSRHDAEQMITGFADQLTAAIFTGLQPKAVPAAIAEQARRRLVQLDAAMELDDLRTPPGNRLEALGGDRRGQHSVRVNDRYRICFRRHDGNAEDVEFVDYR